MTPPPGRNPLGETGNLGGAWRYRITCGADETEGAMSLSPGAGGKFVGKGDGPWDPGTVTVSEGTLQGSEAKLRFLPDAWVEPYLFTGQLTSGPDGERIEGTAARSTGACTFFMDRNAGPAPGFEPTGAWKYTTTCSPKSAAGQINLTRAAGGKYSGQFNGPWEGVPSGGIWDGRVFGYDVKFNFRPDGWNEYYIWKGRFSGQRVEGQVFWRGRAACGFAMTR